MNRDLQPMGQRDLLRYLNEGITGRPVVSADKLRAWAKQGMPVHRDKPNGRPVYIPAQVVAWLGQHLASAA